MEKLEILSEIKKLYEEQNINIIDYLTDDSPAVLSPIDEMISYDIRSGIDVKDYKKNSTIRNNVVSEIAKHIDDLPDDIISILECGCGEGLNLNLLEDRLKKKIKWMAGMDISWSRAKTGQLFGQEHNKNNITFFVGDYFHIPLATNSVDTVFTMQGIYRMGGHESEILEELYRVTRKYLVLIEPSYELAGDEGKNRMIIMNYVRDLTSTAEKKGMKIIKRLPLGYDVNPLNPSEIMIIEKNKDDLSGSENDKPEFICPWTGTKLFRGDDCYYSGESLLAYPILSEIPLLTREHAVVAAKMPEIQNNSMGSGNYA